ncbi:hypothetical protein [Xanthomonas phage JGB6]|nr:hypothetical protein [Xanthomonas phage JGB6]
MQTIQKLIKWNPAALKAKAIKFFAGLGIVFVLVASSYMVGVHNTNNSWETKESTASVALANLQAKNAREAAQRFGEQVKQQAALKAAIDAAKGEVHDYYKNNPVDPRVVEKTKLVQVPVKRSMCMYRLVFALMICLTMTNCAFTTRAIKGQTATLEIPSDYLVKCPRDLPDAVSGKKEDIQANKKDVQQTYHSCRIKDDALIDELQKQGVK